MFTLGELYECCTRTDLWYAVEDDETSLRGLEARTEMSPPPDIYIHWAIEVPTESGSAVALKPLGFYLRDCFRE